MKARQAKLSNEGKGSSRVEGDVLDALGRDERRSVLRGGEAGERNEAAEDASEPPPRRLARSPDALRTLVPHRSQRFLCLRRLERRSPYWLPVI